MCQRLILGEGTYKKKEDRKSVFQISEMAFLREGNGRRGITKRLRRLSVRIRQNKKHETWKGVLGRRGILGGLQKRKNNASMRWGTEKEEDRSDSVKFRVTLRTFERERRRGSSLSYHYSVGGKEYRSSKWGAFLKGNWETTITKLFKRTPSSLSLRL